MDNTEISVVTFDKLASQYQQKYMDADFYTDTYDRFCGFIGNDSATILDIACGPGNITRYLLNKRPGFQIEGIDLAPNMIELARVNIPAATFRVMDSRAISTIGKKFDAVVCGFCTPYLCREDVVKLIADIRSLLRKNGLFYLSTMEDDYEKSGFQSSASGDRVYIYYHPMTFLEREFEKNGFGIVDIKRKKSPVGGDQADTDLFIIARAI